MDNSTQIVVGRLKIIQSSEYHDCIQNRAFIADLTIS